MQPNPDQDGGEDNGERRVHKGAPEREEHGRARGGGHARRREEDRARDGDAVCGCVPARGWASRKPLGEQGTLLMATGPRLRPGDILPSRAHVRIGSDTYVRARFWQYGLRAAN